jgi:hypothetical protein
MPSRPGVRRLLRVACALVVVIAVVTFIGTYTAAHSVANLRAQEGGHGGTKGHAAYGIVTECCEDTYWNLNTQNPSGYTSMEVDVKPYFNSYSANQAYYYALDVWNFENTTNGTYAGLQTNGIINGQTVGKMLIFSLWGADNGISVPGGTGQTFSGEGSGYSERLPYNWTGGNTYLLKIYLTNKTPQGNLWAASVTDLNTSRSQMIGEIYAPLSYGNLSGLPVTFDELYINNPQTTCNAITPSEVAFTNAGADNGMYVSESWNHYVVANVPTGCYNYMWIQNITNGYISAVGVARK